MALANGAQLELTEEDEEKLKEWVESNENFQKTEENASVLALLKGKTKVITLLLWPVWMILSLVYYGMVYMLPLTLAAVESNGEETSEADNGLWGVVLAVLSEFPSIALGYLIVERDMLGRKNSMVLGFIGSGLACLLAGLMTSFMFWVSLARGIINCVFIIASPYTTELYSTNVRTTGLGMSSAASRIGGVIMPWITMALFQIGPTVPYVGFCAFCGIGAFCCYKMPCDTTNKELDFELKNMNDDEKQNELSQPLQSN